MAGCTSSSFVLHLGWILGSAALCSCYEGLGAGPTGDDPTERPSAADSGGSGEGSSASSSSSPPLECTLPPARLWMLTPAQYERTAASIVPMAEGFAERIAGSVATGGRFSNSAEVLHMSLPHVEDLLEAAEALADLALATPDALSPCLAEEPAPRDECVRTTLDEQLPRILRHPLEADERARYQALYEAEREAWGPSRGLHSTLVAAFMSPDFLFRSERGAAASPPEDGVVVLDPFERASAISYLIADGPPDQALWSAAEDGSLDEPDVMREHITRLLSAPETSAGVQTFFAEYFHFENVGEVRKDPERFASFDAALAADMGEELRGLVDDVLWSDDGRLETLLLSTHSDVSGPLAALYGVPDGAELDPAERAGLLTRAGMMAWLARADETNIIERGRFIREELLCQALPAPPPDVNATPPAPDPERTHRQRLQQHSDDSTCSGCHSLMDPLGFAFETYDAVGAYQRLDNGIPVDATGELLDAGDEDLSFDGPIELSRILAEHPQVHRCVAHRLATYVTGHEAAAGDRCDVARVHDAFTAYDGDFITTLIDALSSPRAQWRGVEG